MPTPRRSGGTSATSAPSIRIVPPLGTSTPATRRRSTVLPAPDGPKIATVCPSATLSETRSSAFADWKRFETLRSSMVAMSPPYPFTAPSDSPSTR